MRFALGISKRSWQQLARNGEEGALYWWWSGAVLNHQAP
jgi:hypothetical protein